MTKKKAKSLDGKSAKGLIGATEKEGGQGGKKKAAAAGASEPDECSHCGVLQRAGEASFKRCSRCKLVRYCSVACAKQHWREGHKNECVSQSQQLKAAANTTEEILNKHAPKDFCDPINFDLMTDPVVCADGNTYERSTIETWFKTGNTTSPLTGVELDSTSLIPNVLMRKVILSW